MICAQCGLERFDHHALCPYHGAAYSDEPWADSNRVMCDFVHRGVLPQRLSLAERADPPSMIVLEA